MVNERSTNPPGVNDGAQRRCSRLVWLALLPLAAFVAALRVLWSGEGPHTLSLSWFPALGVDLDLNLDGLALQLVLLITGIGTLVLVYAAGYVAATVHRGRLFLFLLLFMGSMLGAVLADNLILLFVFWELTSLTSFLLVGAKHEQERTRAAAQQALLVTAGGGLVLLAGLIQLGAIAGSYRISELVASAPTWSADPAISATLLLLIVGAFTKSAQIPFHFWLPNAMAAPTPVSAYLHSATMVKLGVYLLARLDPAFDGHGLWQQLLVGFGALTAAWAMVLTLRERDLKRILAWSTVSALGTLVMLVGLPGDGAAYAMAAFLLAHALYKAPLFFVAGNVDHRAGTRDINELAALASRMPWTAAAAALAALSMAGMPFSFGFVAKDLIAVAKYEGEAVFALTYSSLLINAITVSVAGVAAIRVFWRRGGESIPVELREARWPMRLPPLLIALVGLSLGLLPGLADPIVEGAAETLRPGASFDGLDRAADYDGSWYAIAVAALLGVFTYLYWDRLHRRVERLTARLTQIAAVSWYQRVLAAIPALAGVSTRLFQSGRLTPATTLVLATTTLGLGAVAWRLGPPTFPSMVPASLPVVGACLILIVGAVVVCVTRDAFVLVLSSGLIGLGSALLFLFFAAPDLAFTQFAVEVAFVVVLVSIVLRLRRLGLEPVRENPAFPRLLLAGASAVVLVGTVLAATAGTFDTTLPDYFSANAVPAAHGRNVVNVILVDFRALDTLGEIAVLAVSLIAALPLLVLLRRRRVGPERER